MRRVGGPPLRGSPLVGSPVTRNPEISTPPPKMTQGAPNPPSSPSTASSSGVARCWHSNAYFSLFSSLFFFASGKACRGRREGVSQFGTYSVNEAEGTLTLHVDTSSFPNENGTDQERIITSISADKLQWTNPTPTSPGIAYSTLRRASAPAEPPQ